MGGSSKPVILAGGGVTGSGAGSELVKFVENNRIPVATTLMGKGSIPESSDLSLGMAGMHGTPQANLALSHCDLLIAVGTRFSDRTTACPGKFAPSARVIHIDIDESEFDKIRKADVQLPGDAAAVLRELSKGGAAVTSSDLWLKRINEWKAQYPLETEGEDFSAPLIIRSLREKAGSDCLVTTEVGQNQMWSALHWRADEPGKFLTSGGLGTMGFGLPAAIGASFALGRKPVVCIGGDGSLLMNIQELETCSRYDLPVKIFLLNNGTLGMIRQWQEMFAREIYSHTITGNKCDFVRIAEACGLMGLRIDSADELEHSLETVFRHDGPVLVDCRIQLNEKVLPMVPPGCGLDEFLL
jgi:acetolactate synthase-1/2/3 large subunit